MNSNEAAKYSENLRLAREAKGWQEAELARRASVAYPLFGRLRDGRDVYLTNAVKLARALGKSLDETFLGVVPDIESLLPGWGALSEAEREHVRAIVAAMAPGPEDQDAVEHRGRGRGAPPARRAIDEATRRAMDDAKRDDANSLEVDESA